VLIEPVWVDRRLKALKKNLARREERRWPTRGAERLRSIQRLFKELSFDIPTIAQREKVSQAPVEMKARVAQEKDDHQDS
jgi:hypothetical protein